MAAAAFTAAAFGGFGGHGFADRASITDLSLAAEALQYRGDPRDGVGTAVRIGGQ
jgi:hypothetical protein